MIIRRENPSDYDEVYRLVKASFATTPDDDGTTADYVNDIRKLDFFVPQLSLVAENEDGVLVGHIVLYKFPVITPQGEMTQLLMSPISVHPGCFRRGIARTMIDAASRIAVQMGYGAVFLYGNPQIYSKLGFVPTYCYGIFHKEDAAAEWSMVRELYDGALDGIKGTIDHVEVL